MSGSGLITGCIRGASRRSVEPYRLVNDRRRWYLVAWDTDRDAWRTFRADRIELRTPAGPRLTPRALRPDREIAAQVARGADGGLAVPGRG